jgi:ADP-L-glycero-D-manno-heptose 6-epimerase
MWLLEHPKISGLFNVGTGKSRSWLDLSHALFAALGLKPNIEFIDMPDQLIEKYQYFTEANMSKLRLAGYNKAFTELETGISDYVGNFLGKDSPYR